MEQEKQNKSYTSYDFSLEKIALSVIDQTSDHNPLQNAKDTRKEINQAVNERLNEGLRHLISQMNDNTHWFQFKKDAYKDILTSLKDCQKNLDNRTFLQQKLSEVQVKANDYLSNHAIQGDKNMEDKKEAVLCVANSLKNLDKDFQVIQKMDSDFNVDYSLEDNNTYFAEDERVFAPDDKTFEENLGQLSPTKQQPSANDLGSKSIDNNAH